MDEENEGGDEHDDQEDSGDIEQMEDLVEAAFEAIAAGVAVGCGGSRGGGEGEQGRQGDGLERTSHSKGVSHVWAWLTLRALEIYDGRAADVAAEPPLDAVSHPGGVAQMVRATDS